MTSTNEARYATGYGEARIPYVGSGWSEPQRELRWFLRDLYTLNGGAELGEDTEGRLLPVENTLVFPTDPRGIAHALAITVTRLDAAQVEYNRQGMEERGRRVMAGPPSSDRTGPLSYLLGSELFVFGENDAADEVSRGVVRYYRSIEGGEPSPIDGPLVTVEGDTYVSSFAPEDHFWRAASVIARRLGSDEFPDAA